MGRRSLLLAGAALPASVSAYAQCVTDMATVDACLGGVRRTVPAGATLALNFMAPGNLPAGVTFTRASTATYTDANGTIQSAAVNAPRWDYDPVTHALRGLLIEEASAPRAQDRCGISAANMAGWFTSPGGSWFVEFIYNNPTPNNSRIISRGGIATAEAPLFITPPGVVGGQYDGVAAVNSVTGLAVNTIIKTVSTWAAGQAKICSDGGPVATSATLTGGYAVLVTDGVSFMTPSATTSVNNATGWLRRVQYWPRALSDAEMQQVTT